MNKPEMKEPISLDHIEEYDPDFVRKILKKRENDTPIDFPSNPEEFLQWVRSQSYNNAD